MDVKRKIWKLSSVIVGHDDKRISSSGTRQARLVRISDLNLNLVIFVSIRSSYIKNKDGQ